MYHGVFDYGGSIGLTAIFVTRPEVTMHNSSVCLTIAFESHDVGSSYLHIHVSLAVSVTFIYEGHQVKV